MNVLLIAIFLIGQAAQPKSQQKKYCVIIAHHQKKAGEALMRWTQPKPFDYIEGELPSGMKFHYEIGDKTVREIQSRGGKVVILKPDYVLPDLEDARNTCKEFQSS